MPGLATPVKLLNGFDGEQLTQLGCHPLGERSRLAWIQGTRLCDGRLVFVPAAMVFLNRSWNTDEKRITPLISHGLACHRTETAAKQQALLEVYERLHLTVAWHRQDFGVRLPLDGLSLDRTPVLERIERAGLRLQLMAVASPPAIPVVLAAVSGDRFPWITLGSGAGRSMDGSVSHAVAEACGGWQSITKNRTPDSFNQDLEPVTGAGAHVLYYADKQRSAWLLRQLCKGSVRAPAKMHVAETASVEQHICDLASDTSMVSITTPDTAACGFHVVKIVAPGLPLFQFGEIGTPRMNLARAGLPRNVHPHPYP